MTSLASIAGLIFGLFSCADLLHNISLANGNCYDTFYKSDNEKAYENVFNMDLPLTKLQKPSEVSFQIYVSQLDPLRLEQKKF